MKKRKVLTEFGWEWVEVKEEPRMPVKPVAQPEIGADGSMVVDAVIAEAGALKETEELPDEQRQTRASAAMPTLVGQVAPEEVPSVEVPRAERPQPEREKEDEKKEEEMREAVEVDPSLLTEAERKQRAKEEQRAAADASAEQPQSAPSSREVLRITEICNALVEKGIYEIFEATREQLAWNLHEQREAKRKELEEMGASDEPEQETTASSSSSSSTDAAAAGSSSSSSSSSSDAPPDGGQKDAEMTDAAASGGAAAAEGGVASGGAEGGGMVSYSESDLLWQYRFTPKKKEEGGEKKDAEKEGGEKKEAEKKEDAASSSSDGGAAAAADGGSEELPTESFGPFLSSAMAAWVRAGHFEQYPVEVRECDPRNQPKPPGFWLPYTQVDFDLYV